MHWFALFYVALTLMAALGIWACLPSVPLSPYRTLFQRKAAAFFDAIRNDPPPLFLVARNLVREILDEYGPQLQSSTNRNAIMLALTSFFGVVLPPQWAAMGAAYVVVALTVFYLLRTMAGRKRAAGPILTPNDVLRQHVDIEREALRAPGAAYEEDNRQAAYVSEVVPLELELGGGVRIQNTPAPQTAENGQDDTAAAAEAQNAPAAVAPAPARRNRSPRPAAKRPVAKKKAKAKPAKKAAGKRRR